MDESHPRTRPEDVEQDPVPPTSDLDTPSLFDDGWGSSDGTPEEGTDASSDGPGEPIPSSPGGLDDLVTRLGDDRPPRWAMSWRPVGEEEPGEVPGDHHPARTASFEIREDEADRPTGDDAAEDTPGVAFDGDDPRDESPEDTAVAVPSDVPTEPSDPPPPAFDATTPPSPHPSIDATADPAIDPAIDPGQPTETSDEADPAPPEATTPDEVPAEPAAETRPMTTGTFVTSSADRDSHRDLQQDEEPWTIDRETAGWAAWGGWIAAATITAAWVLTAFSTSPSTPAVAPLVPLVEVPVVEPPGDPEPVASGGPLGRPAGAPDQAFLLEEIAVLQQEVAALRLETAAAGLLMADHARLDAESERLSRRWAAAVQRLSYFDAELEREQAERQAIARELDETLRLLDETRSSE
ncbi:MAG: hypothetical protein VX012_04360 [Planctomycetota bacterium]|nr:hypothetical protein [Planctomycetota bacterium]